MRFDLRVKHRIGRPELLAFVCHHFAMNLPDDRREVATMVIPGEVASRGKIIASFRNSVPYHGQDRYDFWGDSLTVADMHAVHARASAIVDQNFPELKPTPQPYPNA